MAKKGDSFEITLKKSHYDWGEYRHTDSRTKRSGEGYIPIPIACARSYKLYNGNKTAKKDVLGENIFNCRSTDGKFCGVIKSQGCREKGDIYAKQFAGNKNLKAIGSWYKEVGASIGDRVRVEFVSPTDIEITLIRT